METRHKFTPHKGYGATVVAALTDNPMTVREVSKQTGLTFAQANSAVKNLIEQGNATRDCSVYPSRIVIKKGVAA